MQVIEAALLDWEKTSVPFIQTLARLFLQEDFFFILVIDLHYKQLHIGHNPINSDTFLSLQMQVLYCKCQGAVTNTAEDKACHSVTDPSTEFIILSKLRLTQLCARASGQSLLR